MNEMPRTGTVFDFDIVVIFLRNDFGLSHCFSTLM